MAMTTAHPDLTYQANVCAADRIYAHTGEDYCLLMAEVRHPDDPRIATCAATVIARLGDRLAEVTRSVQQLVITEIAEFRDPQQVQLVRDSAEGNVDTIFAAVSHAIAIERVVPPTAAIEHARRLAQREVPVTALVRAYRLGQKAVLDAVLEEVRAADLEPQLGLDVYGYIAEITFGYVDWMSQEVVVAYQSERDRWLANRNSLRALRIREVLDGAEIDVDAMTTAIRYPLRRIHLAVVVWCGESDDDDELALLERFTHQLGEAIGAREASLFVPVDRLTGWAWMPLPTDASRDAVERMRVFAKAKKDAPWLAAGNPLPGVEGFRRSHQQAQAARGVAIASGSNTARITAACDHGLSMSALMGANLDQARAWVGEVLGPLAGRSDNDERLRATLQVFLRAGSSFTAAAEELHLHPNSVRYRVQRALERRGRPITDDRLDVEGALLLCYWYGAAILN
jgi:DNA-binding PucR family transcriptional regulator